MRPKRGGKIEEIGADEIQAERAGMHFLDWWYRAGENLWGYRVWVGAQCVVVDVRATLLKSLEQWERVSPLPAILNKPENLHTTHGKFTAFIARVVGRALSEWWTDPRVCHTFRAPAPGNRMIDSDLRQVLVRAMEQHAPCR